MNELLKPNIIKLWRKVDRQGVEDMLRWLETTDFFSAPASKKNHLNYPGGLMEHSYNVYNCLNMKNTHYGFKYSDETIITTSLSHDFCKIDTYKIDVDKASPRQINFLKDISKNDWKDYEELSKKGLISKSYMSALLDFYQGKIKVKPDSDKVAYKFEDEFPLGHGEKSLYLISKFIKLTDEEALAIRWHMGAYDSGYGNSLNDAAKKYDLITLLITADYEATNIMEREKE